MSEQNVLIYGDSKHVRLWVQHYRGEPALCLGRKRSAFVIPLSTAYEFVDDRALLEKSIKAAKVLGFEPATKGEIYGIASAIQHGLGALINCKPESIAARERREQYESGVKMEGSMRVDGKTYEFTM